MDQRYGITRILFNQSLTCPIAFTEMIRRYEIMTDVERATFIASLDVSETGAMMYATARFGDPLAQFAMALISNLNLEIADLFTVHLGEHAANLMHTTLGEMLENDPPVELVHAGAMYLLKHMQQ